MTAVAVNHLDLVRFLLARIDEEVDELRREQRSTDHDPARLAYPPNSTDARRAACEARRSVIGRAQRLIVLRDLPAERPVREIANDLLLALARPYREHRAFRAAWGS